MSLFSGIGNLLGVGSGYQKAIGSNNMLGQYLSAFNKPPQIEKSDVADFVTPEMAELLKAKEQADSEYNNIQTDPAIREAQLQALSEMQGVVDGGGTSIIDDANQRRFLNKANNEAKANRDAISQNMQARGMYGSGMEYVSQLNNSQNAANQISDQALETGANNANRRLGAIESLGGMSSNVRGQEYGEKANRASAQDQINQYNTGLINQTNQLNNANQQAHNNNVANIQNQETQYNIDNKNKINMGNAGLIQQGQQMTNSSLTNLAGNNTNAQIGYGNAISNLGGSLISGGAMLGGAMYTKSDRNAKKDIELFDSSKFLDELTGYKYKYKDSYSDDRGEKIGIMAQDLKKVIPSAVEKIDGVLHVDYNNPELMSSMLGALADINKRLKEVGK